MSKFSNTSMNHKLGMSSMSFNFEQSKRLQQHTHCQCVTSLPIICEEEIPFDPYASTDSPNACCTEPPCVEEVEITQVYQQPKSDIPDRTAVLLPTAIHETTPHGENIAQKHMCKDPKLYTVVQAALSKAKMESIIKRKKW